MTIKESTQTRGNIYDLWLSLIPHVGSIKAQKLIKYFGSSKNLYDTSNSEIQRRIKDDNISSSIIGFRNSFNLKQALEELERKEIDFVSFNDSVYPGNLRQIRDFPLVLYYKGDVSLLSGDMLAVVGTRRYTEYGKLVCRKFVSELSSKFVIVSGMAFGIDSLSHKYALEGGGKTIAVLGSGVDIISPASNAGIYRQIIDNGLIISEYPPGTPPSKGAFPRRNRIISGLSKGVLVIEASKRSGSLITASLALEQGREVFAIPHSVFSVRGYGTNELIMKSEAKLVQKVEDILVEIYGEIDSQVSISKKHVTEILGDNEKKFINMLKNGSKSLDQLCQEIGDSAESILETILELEMKGYVVEETSGRYSLIK